MYRRIRDRLLASQLLDPPSFAGYLLFCYGYKDATFSFPFCEAVCIDFMRLLSRSFRSENEGLAFGSSSQHSVKICRSSGSEISFIGNRQFWMQTATATCIEVIPGH